MSGESSTLDVELEGREPSHASLGSLTLRREWAMPNRNTLSVPPIRGFVDRYLRRSVVSLDPFARNSRVATYRNDLNPDTAAEYHLDALDFLEAMRAKGVRPDMVIFDPPYSPRQLKECYADFGKRSTQGEMQRCCGWSPERAIIREILAPGGVVLSFGWSSNGMGKGFALQEVLLVCHGGGHHDTICIAEAKISTPDLPWGESGNSQRSGD